MSDVTSEATDLLQGLIRNACVNDGTPGSGGEARSVDLLASYLEGRGLDLEPYACLPLVAAILEFLNPRSDMHMHRRAFEDPID